MKSRKARLFAEALMASLPALVVPVEVWGLEMGRTGGTVEDMMVLERE